MLSNFAHDSLFRVKNAMVRWPLLLSHVAVERAVNAKSPGAPAPSREVIAEVQKRYAALTARDLANVRNGYYPRSLLWPNKETAQQLKNVPMALFELPKTFRRIAKGDHRDLPAHAFSSKYPSYYQRNFHWQSDGYFSERSAELYDLQVEWLFLGAANMMRRQIIPAIARYQAIQADPLVVLDVATGTGQALNQISKALPSAILYGLDLSPFYLRAAKANVPNAKWVNDNAESMQIASGSMDVVTCVYLFHELPKQARKNVFAEMYRVLKPGGLLVVQDSVQRIDSKILAPSLLRFAHTFHEPYYKGYLNHDLAGLAEETGFTDVETEVHYVAKNVIARKPNTKSDGI